MNPLPAQSAGNIPRELVPWVDDDTEIVIDIKPSLWSIAIEPVVVYLVLMLLGGLALVVLAGLGLRAHNGEVVLFFVLGLAAAAGLQLIKRSLRRYVLTDRHVLRVSGVLTRQAAAMPIERVQHVVLVRSLLERLTGTGTLGFSAAGTDQIEIAWVTIARPMEQLAKVQQVMDEKKDQQQSRSGGRSDPQPGQKPHEPPVGCEQTGGTPVPLTPVPSTPVTQRGGVGNSEPVVIGLAGGIGAGKSEVARAFAALGCVVADSDKAAREALDREDVKARLVAWWGRDILDAQGQVDRSKVAQIVFEDDDAREKLEALVHPIVRLSRKELRAMAKAADSPAAILDSPLLFEAGLENECDAVVFVEAPREIRLERVRKSRGWDEKELLRREKKQLPLDAKRERSDYCIVNGAQTDTGQLQTQAEHILEQILTHK